MHRLMGLSKSSKVDSIHNTVVWDMPAATWVRVHKRRILATKAEAHHWYLMASRILEKGGGLHCGTSHRCRLVLGSPMHPPL